MYNFSWEILEFPQYFRQHMLLLSILVIIKWWICIYVPILLASWRVTSKLHHLSSLLSYPLLLLHLLITPCICMVTTTTTMMMILWSLVTQHRSSRRQVVKNTFSTYNARARLYYHDSVSKYWLMRLMKIYLGLWTALIWTNKKRVFFMAVFLWALV